MFTLIEKYMRARTALANIGYRTIFPAQNIDFCGFCCCKILNMANANAISLAEMRTLQVNSEQKTEKKKNGWI